MNGPFIHYCTIGNDIEVSVSKFKENEAFLRIEEPDENLGFKELEFNILNHKVIQNIGFNDLEIKRYIAFSVNNFPLIMEASQQSTLKEM